MNKDKLIQSAQKVGLIEKMEKEVSVSKSMLGETSGEAWLNHPQNHLYNSPLSIAYSKNFDSMFGDLYDKLGITPEPLQYIDENGLKKTYIYIG